MAQVTQNGMRADKAHLFRKGEKPANSSRKPGSANKTTRQDLFVRLSPDVHLVPSPLQVACERVLDAGQTGDGPVLVFIEDMTGAGKTEAADYVTHRLIALMIEVGSYCCSFVDRPCPRRRQSRPGSKKRKVPITRS